MAPKFQKGPDLKRFMVCRELRQSSLLVDVVCTNVSRLSTPQTGQEAEVLSKWKSNPDWNTERL